MFLFCNLLKIKGQGVVKMPIKVKLRSENDKIHLKICVGDLLIKNAKLLNCASMVDMQNAQTRCACHGSFLVPIKGYGVF